MPQVTSIKSTPTTISDSTDTLIGTILTKDQDYLKLIFDITINNTTDFKIMPKTLTEEGGDEEEPQAFSVTSDGIACYPGVEIFNRDVSKGSFILDLKRMAYSVKVYIRAATQGATPGTLDLLKAAKMQIVK